MNIAIDPVNVVYLCVFSWFLYASGMGKAMWQLVKANNYGFRRPKNIQALPNAMPVPGEYEVR